MSVRSSKGVVLLVVALAASACLSFAAGAVGAKPTKVRVGLRLASSDTLTVKVASAKAQCAKDRLAVFYEKSTSGGSYARLGSEFTDGKGEYTSGLLGEGFYYAALLPETKGGIDCAGGRSPVVKIKLESSGARAARAFAGRALAPPKVGSWKVIAAEGTSGGIKVTGGVIGSFQVTARKTVTHFHLRFTESGESAGCAGGEGFESKPEGKVGAIRFLPTTTVSVFESAGQWLAAAGASGVGSYRVQPAEVALTVPFGQTAVGSLYITLATTKKVPRSGGVTWGSCGVAFVVKPG